MASLLNRPAFGPYLQLIGANRAYEPAALAIITFAITWGCMALIQVLSPLAPPAQTARAELRTAMADLSRASSGLQKSFAHDTVVQHFNLDVERGEFVSFLGPSRLRQDDDAAHGRRLRGADRRARSVIAGNGHHPADARTSATSAWCSRPTRCFPNMTVARERRLRAEGGRSGRAPRSTRASPRCWS